MDTCIEKRHPHQIKNRSGVPKACAGRGPCDLRPPDVSFDRVLRNRRADVQKNSKASGRGRICSLIAQSMARSGGRLIDRWYARWDHHTSRTVERPASQMKFFFDLVCVCVEAGAPTCKAVPPVSHRMHVLTTASDKIVTLEQFQTWNRRSWASERTDT